ncbi:SPOR domain-containing protein [Gordonia hydrophobica]|uniref:SPOR domain-containing protein n=1 Tax=Gordonia hydrophobica TaxID=40516 RepID=A0ABZ2TZ01_9ACTN|nr:hypothetical protein [Gordonia hydrophobica]MBM7367195.1 hypothetical protein [Gordonia hydrophobica]
MTIGNGDDDRRPTLHGEPLPLPQYTAAGRRPQHRDNGWLVIAVAAAVVLVIGLGGLLAWMVLRDDGTGTAPVAASSSEPAAQTPAPVTPTTQPSAPQPTAETSVSASAASEPRGMEPSGQSPTASTGAWYAQFGAFNEYANAEAEAARHFDAIVLPGATFGLSSRYVVVRPAESETEAREVCSHFAEGTCYVRSR